MFIFFDIDAKRKNEPREKNTLFPAGRAQAEPSRKGKKWKPLKKLTQKIITKLF